MDEWIYWKFNWRWQKEVVCSETESKSLFRFGDGVESKVIKTVNISIVFSKMMLLEIIFCCWSIKVQCQNWGRE